MSKVILELKNVSKKYCLYNNNLHRILHQLKLPLAQSKYSEVWALQDISFQLKEGERLGLIGRNGAGKSTLLKMIAGISVPTSGQITVNAAVQALLELGTGFYPEFTGMQNILSALAYQGLTGKRANNLVEEIIDFSELGKFIEMPVKTYSAGMYSRLAFSTATTIIKAAREPSILIIDEVLGAGDAYFSAKCSNLMKQLTENGNSVLFVSHDIAAVQLICNRAVWIEKGELIMDADTLEVSKEYSASIRRQEDEYLRRQHTALSEAQDASTNHLDSGELSQTLNFKSNCLYGDKKITITNVSFVDEVGKSRAVFVTNERMEIDITWKSTEYFKQLVFAISIYALDGRVVSQAVSDLYDLSQLGYLNGVTKVIYDPLLLGIGEYIISIGVFSGNELLVASEFVPHFIVDREFRIKIHKPSDIHYEYGEVFHPVKWQSSAEKTLQLTVDNIE